MFYIEDNNEIVLFDEDIKKLQNTIAFSMPQYQGLEIKETQEGYTIYDFKIVTHKEMTVKKENKINLLTCTALDIANFIKTLGLTDAEILQFLNANPSIQLQLTLCKDVYCGVVRQLCPIKLSEKLTLTDEMVVEFFKKKYNIA